MGTAGLSFLRGSDPVMATEIIQGLFMSLLDRLCMEVVGARANSGGKHCVGLPFVFLRSTLFEHGTAGASNPPDNAQSFGRSR